KGGFFGRLHRWFIPSRHNDYHPHVFARWGLFILTVLIVGVEGFLMANLISQQTGVNFLAAVEPATVIALTNVQRQDNNLADLADNTKLDEAAQAKAEDMAAKGYFSHVSPDGKEPWSWILQYGYNYQYAGENLAVRFTDSADVVNAWMASPDHRANILKPVYQDIGVGVATGTYQGESAIYVVQFFGTEEVAAAPPSRSAAVAETPAAPSAPSFPHAATSSGSGVVAGVSTQAPVPGVQTKIPAVQSTAAANSSSRVVGWFFAALAVLLMTWVALTFMVQIRRRPHPHRLLFVAFAVAAFSISVAVFNNSPLLTASVTATSQSASVALGSGSQSQVASLQDMAATSTAR
ncbi:MAG: hypothetical protein KGJ34_03045, partial [Patescibacteria group bacterium]|nr:hypothetical protein [Patescibacteria group bacterium]